ncbi:MAG: alanine--glyoxylate aminotransferase family protein [Rhodospirillales bacterium]|nr:alanine--glyoxylate aminotransferase family protein [Rhodospirillales bacterium]MCW9040382.1 alanine--glyoxylate aminotransferase family protein [Rhodospirillales bacterium]
MGPGPSDIHPRVLAALSRPTVGHLDPTFVGMMDEVKEMLRYVFRTENDLTLPISAPGSAGMETCLVNLIEPGDVVVVCVNGVFGGRMKEIVGRCGGTPVVVEDRWGDPVDLQKAEDALKANPGARAMCWVDGETSTGVRSDSSALCALAAKHGALSIVDAVTSLGGTPVLVDEWGADAVYSGSQKCLSCVPGISPVTFGERAVERIRGRNAPVQSWFMDLNLVMGYWGGSGGAPRTYHHTAPVNALYALHESLVMIREEGIQDGWARHRRMYNALAAGLEAMGLGLFVAEEHRLPQLNSVTVPEAVDEAAVRRRLLDDYGLEIGAGLGALAGKVWRIGLMGQSATPVNVTLCLGALESVLADAGAGITVGTALPAANRELTQG